MRRLRKRHRVYDAPRQPLDDAHRGVIIIDRQSAIWLAAFVVPGGSCQQRLGRASHFLAYAADGEPASVATSRRAGRPPRSHRPATGGVAYDFNNMLAIVIGSLDLAKSQLSNGNNDILRYVDNAMDGARSAADFMRRLLAFSWRQALAPVPADADALIKAMEELLRRALAGDIRVETELAQDLWVTFVDPGQLENALLNLAVNARGAVPDGSLLTISTVNPPSPSGSASDQIGITVSDDSSEIEPTFAARALGPFFTKKEIGRRTGLDCHRFIDLRPSPVKP